MESSEVTWELDGITMAGTVARPDGAGPFPAVVFVAGSGPTDRNWCSPLLPGDNGSARLLAEAFARAGIASLRYDKRASGPHAMENVPKLLGTISMRSHLDELVAAVGVLEDLSFVDGSRLAGLGNSEGTIHVLHYAASDQEVPFVGIVLAAPPGRPIHDLLLTQLDPQLSQLADGAALMDKVRQAADRFSAGRPMDPDPTLPEGVRMVLASFETPVNLPFARELWTESAVDCLARVRIPTLVVIGGKDAQVDVHLDGDPLQHAASGLADVTFAFPATANHVLKEDTRSRAEVAASPAGGYNTPGTRLDPEALTIITEWLQTLFQRGGTPAS